MSYLSTFSSDPLDWWNPGRRFSCLSSGLSVFFATAPHLLPVCSSLHLFICSSLSLLIFFHLLPFSIRFLLALSPDLLSPTFHSFSDRLFALSLAFAPPFHKQRFPSWVLTLDFCWVCPCSSIPSAFGLGSAV